jgi:iron complex outermembrane receptor protein
MQVLSARVGRISLCASSVLCALSAWAQAQNPSVSAAALPTVTITGNPLGATDLIAPASVLSGSELLLDTQVTLGETLGALPGVSSTYFGPNASRPVIRGMDGDRLKLLANGTSLTDVSGLSYDHAVSADPLTVERIEVLRGPAALQYGGHALGGVVNLIDNRISRQALFDAQGGMAGKAQLSTATGNREQSGSVVLEAGNDRYTLHADVMSRHTQDVAAPKALSCRGGVASRICNSASQAWGGALGGTLHFDQGYLGASVATQSNLYGSVADEAVQLDMRSNRYAVEGEVGGLSGFLSSVKAQFTQTDYRHAEMESGQVGTVFASKGSDLRLQARHADLLTPWGQVQGVVGAQLEETRFSADGAEAFAPSSKTLQSAMFVHEELPKTWGRLSAGVRVERVGVSSLGGANQNANGFVVGEREFTPLSYALGGLWKVAPAWSLTSNLSWSARAPRDYELFALGKHLATQAFERGNNQLGLERSSNLDVGAQWRSGASHAKLNVFVNQFSNYISLQATGQNQNNLPEYLYTPVQARFIGAEASGLQRLVHAAHQVDVSWRWDTVRADNLDTAQALPRISPMRLGATLIWSAGPWQSRLGVDQWAAQDRVPASDKPSEGYTLWHAASTYKTRISQQPAFWFARLDNIGNTLAYSASSILTQTLPGQVPLPGRSLKVGLQVQF